MGVARAYSPPTELHGQFGKVTPLVNAAMIQKTNGGYRFTAGKQNSHITVTMGHGKIHFRDTGTRELRNIPKQCKRHSAGKGIGAVCNVPRGYNARHPMYVEVWPRLGNDYVNGRSLPASTRLWVLADRGTDTVFGGAGRDFVNGAQNRDHVSGGPGNDWLRTGTGGDHIWGGGGKDKIVGADGGDSINGGGGSDHLYGAHGRDTIRAGRGSDTVVCGSGSDRAMVHRGDRTNGCERVHRG